LNAADDRSIEACSRGKTLDERRFADAGITQDHDMAWLVLANLLPCFV
jgi:hypothetical protein